MNVQEAYQNVVGQLQKHPGRYRAFGVYWWPLKRMLKAAGYTKDHLFYLGDYENPETAERVPPGLELEQMLRAAFICYQQNVLTPHTGGVVEDPDGELVVILDEDAGGF